MLIDAEMTDGNVPTHRSRTITCLATFEKTDMILIMIDRLAGRHQRRIEAVREALLDKIRNGLLRPGDRFFSARALSLRYNISYQTGDRVLSQLAEEGYVERRAVWNLPAKFRFHVNKASAVLSCARKTSGQLWLSANTALTNRISWDGFRPCPGLLG